MDKITKEARSEVMRRIRASDTKFERKIIDELRKLKLAFSLHAPIAGKPDIVSTKNKVAIFLDSCFWHGCRWHCRMPRSRQDYWQPKIERNKQRARDVNRVLRKEGWKVVRIWEHKIQQDFDGQISYIASLLRTKSKQ